MIRSLVSSSFYFLQPKKQKNMRQFFVQPLFTQSSVQRIAEKNKAAYKYSRLYTIEYIIRPLSGRADDMNSFALNKTPTRGPTKSTHNSTLFRKKMNCSFTGTAVALLSNSRCASIRTISFAGCFYSPFQWNGPYGRIFECQEMLSPFSNCECVVVCVCVCCWMLSLFLFSLSAQCIDRMYASSAMSEWMAHISNNSCQAFTWLLLFDLINLSNECQIHPSETGSSHRLFFGMCMRIYLHKFRMQPENDRNRTIARAIFH